MPAPQYTNPVPSALSLLRYLNDLQSVLVYSGNSFANNYQGVENRIRRDIPYASPRANSLLQAYTKGTITKK